LSRIESAGRGIDASEASLVADIRPASFNECLLVAFHPERHTDAVSNGELQGWHADPFGLHEIRYFSAGRPTKLVRDGRVDSYDEPPAEDYTSAAVVAGAPAGGDPAATSDGPSIQSAQGSFAPRKRRGLEYTVVAAVAVGVVVALVAILDGSSGSPGMASAAFVTAAAQRTLAQSTADVTLSGTVQASGQTLSLGGQGQVDFATSDMSLNVGASSSGGSLTEHEVLAGGNIYLQLVVNGHNLAAAIGGRHWLQVPYAQAGSPAVTNGSPAWSLSLLKQKGARVTSLGTRSIDGRTCSGYAVTPTRQTVLAGAQAEWTRLGLSHAQTSTALQTLQRAAPPTVTVWFDSQRKLACQMNIDMQVGNPTSSGSGSVQMVMDFTHYGVPVNVTPPAPSDTVSLRQLVQGLRH
jgi:hypothetical protein